MGKSKSSKAGGHHAFRDGLVMVPLGGCGEIGMNLTMYGTGGKWLMVDCGMTFADDNLPGIDIVVHDPTYAETEAEDILGLVITHGHEDHLGAVHHLWHRFRCPVYATPFAAELLVGKFREAGIEDEVDLRRLDERRTAASRACCASSSSLEAETESESLAAEATCAVDVFDAWRCTEARCDRLLSDLRTRRWVTALFVLG